MIRDILTETELKVLHRILNKLRDVHTKCRSEDMCLNDCPLDKCGCIYEDLADLLYGLDEIIKND